jgi:hypothetical protein
VAQQALAVASWGRGPENGLHFPGSGSVKALQKKKDIPARIGFNAASF